MGIVRNPYDRAVSLCAYSLDYTRELGQWGPLSVKAFELWVKHGCLCRYVCNPDLPFSRNVAEPQVHWFVPSQVDRLLWFEDLPGARREVERVTGCKLDDRQRKPSLRLATETYYQRAWVRERIATLYAVDFEMFGYI
jgi:hypothetical protein